MARAAPTPIVVNDTQEKTMPSTQRSPSRKPMDALTLLKADHDKVKKLIKEFEKLHEDESEDEAEEVAQQICKELTVHAALEEEIFYPEVRSAIGDEDILDESEVEHAVAKNLIEQIESGEGDEKYAAKVSVLGEITLHHIEEEQKTLFPKVKKAKDLDLDELGQRLMSRKQELMSEMGMEDEEEEEE
jgi:hemerythrin superfamily protein